MRILLVVLLFALTVQARDASFDQVFVKPGGASVRLSQLAAEDDKKPWLVLFWAGWCVPCKAELELVADYTRETNWTDVQIVAVNVDEDEDWASASGILEKVNWPHFSVRDIGGAYFFETRASGELPYGLWLDAAGNTQKVITHLDRALLEELRAQALEQKEAQAEATWSASTDLHYRSSDTPKKSQLAAGRQSLQYSSENYTGLVTYKILGQGLQDKGVWEDELADSFIERKSKNYRLRLGDDSVSWLGGRLLSVRKIFGTDEDYSLLGLHYHHFFSRSSLSFVAGGVRNSLYGSKLDPSTDVSKPNPKQTAYGLKYTAIIGKGSISDIQMTLAAANYHHEASTNPLRAEHKDNRVGLSLKEEDSGSGYQIDYARFFLDTVNAKFTDSDPYFGQLSAWTTLGPVQLPLSVLEYRLVDSTRVLLMTLVEEPGTALDSTSEIQSVRFNPKWNWSKTTLGFSVVHELALEVENRDQISHALSMTYSPGQFKGTLMQQNKNELGKKSEETIFQFGGYVFPVLSFQATRKWYKSPTISGRSRQMIWGLELSKWLAKSWESHWVFQYNQTDQTDHYRNFTLIDKPFLNSYALSVSWKKLQARVTVGEEAGGFVCANGVCASRPPLDGSKLDFSYTYQF